MSQWVIEALKTGLWKCIYCSKKKHFSEFKNNLHICDYCLDPNHPERLSEKAQKGCDSLNKGITEEAFEEDSKKSSPPQGE